MSFLGWFAGRAHPLEDAEAFARFYEDTHLNIFRYVMASCGGVESLAEDVTAEAYLRAWKSRGNFSGTPDAAFGWVLTIARHLLMDHFRASSLHPPANDPVEDLQEDRSGNETILIRQELTAQLIGALQRLPENRREMVILRYVLGWQVNQIARHLSMPPNTISVSIHRSLKQLQEFLALQGVSNERTE